MVGEPAPVAAPVSMAVASPTPVQFIGLISLSIYLISAWATDFSYRFLGTKPYLSMVTGILVFLCFIISGKALAALRTTAGKLWFGLGLWMVLSIVFSRWRGGSFELMQAYFPKQHMIPLYMAAFAVTVPNCRTLLRACTVGGFILLLSCIFLGGVDVSGRYVIPTNLWLANPNDLAIQLLLCLGFFLFWIRQPSWTGRVLGVIGMAGAFFFLPRTGSRGGLISASIFVLLWIFFSKNRIPLLIGAVFLGAIALVLTPGQTLQRLTQLTADETTAGRTGENEKAVSSQLEREHLLKAAINYTLRNPLFGVGPGEFPDAIWEDAKREGRHEASLGPHNTYAQIGAECGFPGLIMFVLAIFTTMRSSYRLYRATLDKKEYGLISAIAFSCFVLIVAYAVDLCFHHVAYSGNLVVILGLWISVEIAAKSQGIQFEPVRNVESMNPLKKFTNMAASRTNAHSIGSR